MTGRWRGERSGDVGSTALRRAGLNLHTVVEAGGEVAVRTVSSHNRREDNATVTDRVDPDLVAVARAAAGAVGVRLAGVDCVVKDVPNWSAGGAVIEVNGTPGMNQHYVVSDPAGASPVAASILEVLLRP